MKPRAPKSTTYPLRIPHPLLAKFTKIATDEKRTVAYVIRDAMEWYVEHRMDNEVLSR